MRLSITIFHSFKIFKWFYPSYKEVNHSFWALGFIISITLPVVVGNYLKTWKLCAFVSCCSGLSLAGVVFICKLAVT